MPSTALKREVGTKFFGPAGLDAHKLDIDGDVDETSEQDEQRVGAGESPDAGARGSDASTEQRTEVDERPGSLIGTPALAVPTDLDVQDEQPGSPIAIAREALEEIAPKGDIGAPIDVRDEGEGVYTIRFSCMRISYPGWVWTATLVQLVDEKRPSVLEVGLVPGHGAILAPAWRPWAERLAEYEAALAAEAEASARATDEDADTASDGVNADGEATAPRQTMREVRRIEGTRRRRRTRRRVSVAEGDAQHAPEEETQSAATADAENPSNDREAEDAVEDE